VAVYADGATRHLRWCSEGDHLPMSRAALNSWIAGLLAAGAAPATPHPPARVVASIAESLFALGEWDDLDEWLQAATGLLPIWRV